MSIGSNVNYDMPRIQKVMQSLNDDFHRDVSVAEVKALVNMSEPTFRRFIKRHSGKSCRESAATISGWAGGAQC